MKHQSSGTLFFMCDTKDEGVAYLDSLRNGYHGLRGWVYHGLRGRRHAFTAELCRPIHYIGGAVQVEP